MAMFTRGMRISVAVIQLLYCFNTGLILRKGQRSSFVKPFIFNGDLRPGWYKRKHTLPQHTHPE